VKRPQGTPRHEEQGFTEALMEWGVDPNTIEQAISRLKANKMVPKIDGMTR